jgi:hypothetical protein
MEFFNQQNYQSKAKDHVFDHTKIKLFKNVDPEELANYALDEYVNSDDKKNTLTK